MDEDMDARIGGIARRATHPGLAGMESTVLARIAAERAARARNWRLDMIAMAGALAIGMGAAATLTAPTRASDLALFDDVSRLAPSTLLGAGH